MTIYDFEVRRIDGRVHSMDEFRGHPLLIVNVASECGFTPQYAGLEALHRRFKDRGFLVLGFPCNQFGRQEPGSEEDIQRFCTSTFGVSFPMFAKVDVNGPQTHPLFEFLKRERPGVAGTTRIKWNFTKFLVGADGTVQRRYGPTTPPDEIAPDVEAVVTTGPPRDGPA